MFDTLGLKSFFDNKSILILGFGREGRSTLNLLTQLKCVKSITIADKNKIDITDFIDKVDFDMKSICGENYLDTLTSGLGGDYDIIMKSPGIPLFTIEDRIPGSVKAKITCQCDLFLRFCDNITIGITGTKGKSTVSSLVHHILTNTFTDTILDNSSVLIGNIGIPPFDVALTLENETVVLELSCHQLEYTKSSPNIGVFLNLFEEHLDHYKSFNEYKKAKENIFRYMKKGDILIKGEDYVDENLYDVAHLPFPPDFPVFHTTFSFPRIDKKRLNIKGEHNFINAKIAFATAFMAGLLKAKKVSSSFSDFAEEKKLDTLDTLSAIANGDFLGTFDIPRVFDVYTPTLDFRKAVLYNIYSFKGLPHRLEVIDKGTIRWINDSISTVPAATIAAVNAFPLVDTLIIGGMDRGIDYTPLIEFLENDNIANNINIITLPNSGHKIADVLISLKRNNIHKSANLEAAVTLAKSITKRCCIFSPAAASYGFYENFEKRGDHFKQLINQEL